jgi:hypothetical protein
LAFPAALLSLIGRILSSSKLAARPQCLIRLQFLLAFRSLFVVLRCFETRLVSLSHLSEVVSSFISAGGLYRMNPGGAPHSYPCGHVMTSTIHVQGGQKPKKKKKGEGVGHDKLLLHGHSSMPGDCTRFRAKSVPEFQVHLYSKRLFVPAPLKPPHGLPTSSKLVDDANSTSNASPWNGILRSKGRTSQTRAYRPCGNCRMEEDKPAHCTPALHHTSFLSSLSCSWFTANLR